MSGRHPTLDWLVILSAGALAIFVWWADQLPRLWWGLWFAYAGALLMLSWVAGGAMKLQSEHYRLSRDAMSLRDRLRWFGRVRKSEDQDVGQDGGSDPREEVDQLLEVEKKKFEVIEKRVGILLTLLTLGVVLMLLIVLAAAPWGKDLEANPAPEEESVGGINEGPIELDGEVTKTGSRPWVLSLLLITGGVGLAVGIRPRTTVTVLSGTAICLSGVLNLKPGLSLNVELPPLEVEFRAERVVPLWDGVERLGWTKDFPDGLARLGDCKDIFKDDRGKALREELAGKRYEGFVVIGHADERPYRNEGGTDIQTNRQLAERRAEWVGGCLESHGYRPLLAALASGPANLGGVGGDGWKDDRRAQVLGIKREDPPDIQALPVRVKFGRPEGV